MKVGTRITLATAVVAGLASGIYAYADLRAHGSARREALEAEAQSVGLSTRASLEAAGPGILRGAPEPLSRELSRSAGAWRITVLPRTVLGTEAPEVIPGVTAGQMTRLQRLIEIPRSNLFEDGADLVFDLPLRGRPSATESAPIAGLLEVATPLDRLDEAATRDRLRAGALVALVVLVTTLAAGLLARNLVSRPIRKLLGGIDDVAKGDLSHVILSERDDEIGAIATRFNEMTFSLRESRAETGRQNQAKLDLEQRLSHTEKLATIGQLAAEIAHEVGTPLNVIAGRAKTIKRKAADPAQVEKNAQIVAEQTARITRIIQRLLDFARRKAGQPEKVPVQLNEVTLITMELLGGQFANARIRTTLARAEGLPRVSGDADRLQQVLLNLLLNAIQAMPEGGTLRVETSAVTRQRPGLELSPEQAFACVEITDSGVGIAPDKREKIFEPFYTTKEGRGGTGLGLAVCFGIVKEHDGWIEIADASGGGTTFRVFLPTTDEPPRARPPTEPPPTTARFHRA